MRHLPFTKPISLPQKGTIPLQGRFLQLRMTAQHLRFTQAHPLDVLPHTHMGDAGVLSICQGESLPIGSHRMGKPNKPALSTVTNPLLIPQDVAHQVTDPCGPILTMTGRPIPEKLKKKPHHRP